MDAVIQFFRIVLVAGIILTLLLVGGFIGVFGADTIFGPKAADMSNITYPGADGTTLLAYINIPPGPEMRPGIIMAPDYWGLDEQMRRLANLLSDSGYVVIVPDLYRGAASAVLPRALLLGLLTPDDRAARDLRSAHDYLISLDTVNPDAVGVIGLGFGGGAAMRYAASDARVSAVVNAYGAVITSPEALGELRGPLMGLFVARDSLVQPQQVDQLRALLDDAGIENDLILYSHLDRGFLRFPEVTVVGSSVYNAWHRIVAFLDTQLK
jgi:carboxymethylenebutenolidase